MISVVIGVKNLWPEISISSRKCLHLQQNLFVNSEIHLEVNVLFSPQHKKNH